MLGLIERKRKAIAHNINSAEYASAFYLQAALADERYVKLRELQSEYARIAKLAQLTHNEYLHMLDVLDIFESVC